MKYSELGDEMRNELEKREKKKCKRKVKSVKSFTGAMRWGIKRLGTKTNLEWDFPFFKPKYLTFLFNYIR